ncbi:MAG: hypothetical protein IT494_01195 [Gammaproteobacteria bacterium]|nr:hypothetical protein [Gammaproteobacteria bacterium]
MSRTPPSRVLLLTLACIALLFRPVGSEHLHLCFDGSEPPASLHLFDLGVHHAEAGYAEPGSDATHHDSDVALSDNALTKSKPERTLVLALLVAVSLSGLLPAPRRFLTAIPLPARTLAPPHLRPPLRGPPLLTSR